MPCEWELPVAPRCSWLALTGVCLWSKGAELDQAAWGTASFGQRMGVLPVLLSLGYCLGFQPDVWSCALEICISYDAFFQCPTLSQICMYRA